MVTAYGREGVASRTGFDAVREKGVIGEEGGAEDESAGDDVL